MQTKNRGLHLVLMVCCALLTTACPESGKPSKSGPDSSVGPDVSRESDVPTEPDAAAGPDVGPDVGPQENYTVHEWGVVFNQRLQSAPTHYLSMDDKPILYFYSDIELDVDVELKFTGGTGRETWPEVELGTTLKWPGLHISDSPCQNATPFPSWGEGQCPYPYDEPCEVSCLANYVVDEASCLTFGSVKSPLLFYAGILDDPFVPVAGTFESLLSDPPTVHVVFKPDAGFVGKYFVIYRDIEVAGGEWDGPVTVAAKFAYEMVEVPDVTPGDGFSIELMPEEVFDDADVPGFGPPQDYDLLTDDLSAILTAQGLTNKETEAFLTAWQHIFFGSNAYDSHPHVPGGQSVAIIGIHAQSICEELTPLTLTPPPKELVRVLVSLTYL